MIKQVLIVCLFMIIATGCGGSADPQTQANINPIPTYTGPDFFRTTIGSITQIQGYSPLLVSGIGLMVHLDNTGSPDCPPQIRQWMINELSRGGFGMARLNMRHLTPETVLASRTTALVIVEAVIPPGATKGKRFDVMVKALPGTQTTSLENGVLYTTDLKINGALIGRPASRPYAKAHGPIFINPFKKQSQRTDDPKVGRILAGGVVVENMRMVLKLNEPSYALSRRIADRINGRYPQSPSDQFPLANAISPETIEIRVLNRFKGDPKEMLTLLRQLYMNPTDTFAQAVALDLIDHLRKPENAKHADLIAATWRGTGRLNLPIFRKLYNDENPVVRLTALDAGANLGDLRTNDPLYQVASKGQGNDKDKATRLLGALLLQHNDNFRISTNLRNLMNSSDALVRLAAFKALANADDGSINRRVFEDKMELDIVRSKEPMIFVTQSGIPRVVIFDPMLGFKDDMFFSTWQNQLMVRNSSDGPLLSVRYKGPEMTVAKSHKIAPAVANLVLLMANRPTKNNPSPGYNLSYNQIVQVLARMTETQDIPAKLVLEQSYLSKIIESSREADRGDSRPETDTNNTSDVEK